MSLRWRVYDVARMIIEFFEDHWFDRTRHVRTSGNMSLPLAGISAEDVRDSELYVPARPAHVREALRAIPVRNVPGYTYVDLGSGKGRTLFVAAELPFRQIVGVEFSGKLHDAACVNIRNFRRPKNRRSGELRSIYKNAAEFVFPEGPLVLYFFNPFGASTMQQVLSNLESSLKHHPRHVVVVLLWPRCGDQVARINGMRLVCRNKHHEIFEVHAPSI